MFEYALCPVSGTIFIRSEGHTFSGITLIEMVQLIDGRWILRLFAGSDYMGQIVPQNLSLSPRAICREMCWVLDIKRSSPVWSEQADAAFLPAHS